MQQDRGEVHGVAEGDRLYRALQAELAEIGCFAPAPLWARLHLLSTLGLYAVGYLLVLEDFGWPARVAGLWLVAFACVQASFVGHEAGHGALTRDRRLATVVGHFCMTLLTGMGYGHFQSIHRRHHPWCNVREADPDMRSTMFRFFPQTPQRRALRAWVARRQAWLLWPLVSLQGFTLKTDSMVTLWRHWRSSPAELGLLAAHLLLWFGPPVWLLGLGPASINYLLMTWFIGPYLGIIFPVNHIGRRSFGQNERVSHFFRQLDSTRNLGTGRFSDYLFGGLNNHIEHHLFPSIPKQRLRHARRITRAFCQRHDLAYQEQSWLSAVADVSAHLRQIAHSPANPASTSSIATS